MCHDVSHNICRILVERSTQTRSRREVGTIPTSIRATDEMMTRKGMRRKRQSRIKVEANPHPHITTRLDRCDNLEEEDRHEDGKGVADDVPSIAAHIVVLVIHDAEDGHDKRYTAKEHASDADVNRPDLLFLLFALLEARLGCRVGSVPPRPNTGYWSRDRSHTPGGLDIQRGTPAVTKKGPAERDRTRNERSVRRPINHTHGPGGPTYSGLLNYPPQGGVLTQISIGCRLLVSFMAGSKFDPSGIRPEAGDISFCRRDAEMGGSANPKCCAPGGSAL